MEHNFEVVNLGNGLYQLRYRGQKYVENDVTVYNSDVTFQLTFKTAEQAKEYASKWTRENRPAAKSEFFTVKVEDDANPSGNEVRGTPPAGTGNPVIEGPVGTTGPEPTGSV